jgi:Ca-activated chloride channel family protein
MKKTFRMKVKRSSQSTRFFTWLLIGMVLVVLGTSIHLWLTSSWHVQSPEQTYQVLREKILPTIHVDRQEIPEQLAARYSTQQLEEPLPALENFPLYGAQPTQDPNIIYLEIFSSAEKANALKQDERWLVDVADAFNAKKLTIGNGQTIQVGIRNISSGEAARMIAAKAAKPTGYTPQGNLWLEILKQDGIMPQLVTDKLLPNYTGLVIQDQVYQQLAVHGQASFDQLLDAILAGKVSVGYPNPYTSASSLNLLYALLWRAAGHQQDHQSLTLADLQSPQVKSVFDAFQQQVLVTTRTSGDLKEIFIRDQQKLQAFTLDYLSYVELKKLPEFAQTGFIPFGVPQTSPLVGFDWNTPIQQEALKRFSEFATSPTMQQLAKVDETSMTYLHQKDLPPTPSGEVLKAAQSFWKLQKDGGHTAYLMMVIDTSGSMQGNRIHAVQTGLRIASKEINRGNYVGLMTFNNYTRYLVPIAPFDTLQYQRLLAATEMLRADGQTAMYDALMAGLAELLAQRQRDPDGRFYLILLSDGEANLGIRFKQVEEVLANSGVRIYPIAYGDVNQQELHAIAALRESTVQVGDPKNVQQMLKELLQTNL